MMGGGGEEAYRTQQAGFCEGKRAGTIGWGDAMGEESTRKRYLKRPQ